MRRRAFKRPDASFEAINVTPMVDVVMCLIIFFLVVGTLAANRGAFVDLPQSKVGVTESKPTVVVVTIARDASAAGWPQEGVRVQVDGEDVTTGEALSAAVRARIAERPELGVQIRADKTLPYGAVESVLAGVREAGMNTVRFATERGA